MDRRRYLALSGTGLALLAGCSSSDTEPASQETSTEAPEETEEPDTEPSTEESADGSSEQPTDESADDLTEQDLSYQVRISYDGEWSGSIGSGGSTRSVDGSGTETFDIDGEPFIVSANAQKQDDGSGELTVEILQDGEVIARKTTSAEYGLAQVTSEDGISSEEGGADEETESRSTYEVRIEYSGEWQGSISAGGSSRSIDGTGSETVEIDGSPDVISANAQKTDDNSQELIIQIIEDGNVVEQTSTTAEYGVAQVTHSNF